MNLENDILNSQEIASLLRVSKKTIFELVVRDKLPCRKVGREYRFFRSAVLLWLQTTTAPRRQARSR